jgi:hypothetical protein
MMASAFRARYMPAAMCTKERISGLALALFQAMIRQLGLGQLSEWTHAGRTDWGLGPRRGAARCELAGIGVQDSAAVRPAVGGLDQRPATLA